MKNQLFFVALIVFGSSQNMQSSSSKDLNKRFKEVVKKHDAKLIKLFLEQGADVNFVYENGITALMIAVMNNDLGLVKSLLDQGANIDTKDSLKRTAIDIAIRDGNIPIVQLLLDRGAKDWDTSLKFELTSIEEDPTEEDKRMLLTFEFQKAMREYRLDVKLIRSLLEQGADVNDLNLNNGMTALMFAVNDNDLELVKLFLDAGAKVNAKDVRDNTALMEADSIEVAKLLLDRGADVNSKNKDGATSLMGAALKNNLQLVKLLLDRGANVNAKSNYGITSLKYPIDKNNADITKLLLKAGARIPDELTVEQIDWLDEIIKEINSEIDQENDLQRILMFEQSGISMPVYDLVTTLHRLPLASEVYKQRKEEEAAKAMQRVG